MKNTWILSKLKKLHNTKVVVISIFWWAWNSSSWVWKETGWMGDRRKIKTILTPALFRSARILGRVLVTWGHLYQTDVWKTHEVYDNNNNRITKGTEGFGSWRTNGDHPNYSSIENVQNTEKSPGDLRRLYVTQTPVKDHQLMLMWKTLMNK